LGGFALYRSQTAGRAGVVAVGFDGEHALPGLVGGVGEPAEGLEEGVGHAFSLGGWVVAGGWERRRWKDGDDGGEIFDVFIRTCLRLYKGALITWQCCTLALYRHYGGSVEQGRANGVALLAF